MNTKSLIISGGLAAAITAGSLGVAAFGVPSIAGAQGASDAPSAQQAGPASTDAGTGVGRHRARGEAARKVLKAVADELGMKPADLRAELKSGKSVADVATEKGVDVPTLINNLTTKADARIDQAVANGKITAERGDTMKQNAPERITTMVNRHFGTK